jgi:hypothetical protein
MLWLARHTHTLFPSQHTNRLLFRPSARWWHRWQQDEQHRLETALHLHPQRPINWSIISSFVGTRTATQCRLKILHLLPRTVTTSNFTGPWLDAQTGIKRGRWTLAEDALLRESVGMWMDRVNGMRAGPSEQGSDQSIPVNPLQSKWKWVSAMRIQLNPSMARRNDHQCRLRWNYLCTVGSDRHSASS